MKHCPIFTHFLLAIVILSLILSACGTKPAAQPALDRINRPIAETRRAKWRPCTHYG